MAASGKSDSKKGGTRRGRPVDTTAGDDGAVVDRDAYFAGVEELRAYLDRSIQDPDRRRARLGRVAQELLKPRDPASLGAWLTEQLGVAVGASGCALMLAATGWTVHSSFGTLADLPAPAELQARLASDKPSLPEQHRAVPIQGVDGLTAALWIEGGGDLDPVSLGLLDAVAQTAGILFDQALGADLLRRDTMTGLLTETAFLEPARQLLQREPKSGMTHVIAAFRVAGLEAVAAAYGMRAANEAIRSLASAVRETLPADAVLGARFDDVLGACGPLAQESVQVELNRTTRAVEVALRARTGPAGAVLAVSSAFVTADTVGFDVAAGVRAIARRVAEASAGSAVRVTLEP